MSWESEAKEKSVSCLERFFASSVSRACTFLTSKSSYYFLSKERKKVSRFFLLNRVTWTTDTHRGTAEVHVNECIRHYTHQTAVSCYLFLLFFFFLLLRRDVSSRHTGTWNIRKMTKRCVSLTDVHTVRHTSRSLRKFFYSETKSVYNAPNTFPRLSLAPVVGERTQVSATLEGASSSPSSSSSSFPHPRVNFR